MTADEHARREGSADAAKETPSLARTIRRRTTDLLAIAIIAVAGLTMGRQLAEWWAREPADAPLAIDAGGADWNWNDPGVPIDVTFGDGDVSLHRERFEGDAGAAIEELVRRCREVAGRSPRPESPIDESERRLLAATAKLEPVRSDESVDVYFVPVPMPTVVAVRNAESGGTGRDAARVVCSGMALGGGTDWTLFLFEPRGSSPTERVETSLPIALPPSARRTMSIRDRAGDGVVGFEGDSRGEAWRAFFDERFAEEGGRREVGWRKPGNVWAARYLLNRDGRRVAVDVQYEVDDSDLHRGWMAIRGTAADRDEEQR